MDVKSWQVTDTLMQLADTLVSDYDLLEYLDQLLVNSSDALTARAGGVMLSDAGDGRETLQVLACTDEQARLLEVLELQRQEGPCLDSFRRGEQVIEEDLRSTTLWPRFTPAAIERGYGSVFAFPLRLRGSVIGVLNLFRTESGAVAHDEIRAAQAFADMATIGILHQRAVREAHELAGHLKTALNSRVVIEQAKGVLAERLRCEIDEAYQAIRWYGRNHNRPLREVAAAVVNGTVSAHELVKPYDASS